MGNGTFELLMNIFVVSLILKLISIFKEITRQKEFYLTHDICVPMVDKD